MTRRKWKRLIVLLTAVLLVLAALFAVYNILFNSDEEVIIMGNLEVTSSVFKNDGFIPTKYTGVGEEMSPPLKISGVDPDAVSIAMIVDDPDAPITPDPFIHWVIYNIPSSITDIGENIPNIEVVDSLGGAMQGNNGIEKIGYLGPKPPYGTHTYRFIVYTLDTVLDLAPGATRAQLEKAMEGHILQTGLLKGKFSA